MNTNLKNWVVSAMFIIIPVLQANAQVSINIDGSKPDSTAMLDIKSTDKGILIPRMSSTQRNAISTPSSGLLVYVNDSKSFWFFNGNDWIELSPKIQSDWSQNNNAYSDYIKNKPTLYDTTHNPWMYSGGIIKERDTIKKVGFGTNTAKGLFDFVTPTVSGDTHNGFFSLYTGGNLLLGQSNSLLSQSPGITSKFEIQSQSGWYSDMNVRTSVSNWDYAPFYWISKSYGTLEVPLNVANGCRIGGFIAAPYYNGVFRTASKFEWFVVGSPLGDTVPVDLVYSNHGWASNSDYGIERLRIKDNGDLILQKRLQVLTIPTLVSQPSYVLTPDANNIISKYSFPAKGNDSTWIDNGYSAKKQTSLRDTVQIKMIAVTNGIIAPNYTLSASDTSAAVKGKSVFISVDSSYYDCRSTTSAHKWWKRKY